MGLRKKILVVDDDDNILSMVCMALSREGYLALPAKNGEEALKRLQQDAPDLVLLDIFLPDTEGTEVCRIIRKTSEVPIIFVTCKDSPMHMVEGLSIGADDYIGKPFEIPVLVARIRALLRRALPRDLPVREEPPPLTLSFAGLVMDLETFSLSLQGREIVLTRTEFDLLRTLMERPGRVYSRDQLIDLAYGHGHYITQRTIDTHVKALRKKMGKPGRGLLQTIRGRGYCLGEGPE